MIVFASVIMFEDEKEAKRISFSAASLRELTER